MITKQMGLMDFSKSAAELERLVRGLNPWPSAFTFYNGKTLKVWESFVAESDDLNQAEPGTVVKADKKGIYVACGEGVWCFPRFSWKERNEWMQMHSFADAA